MSVSLSPARTVTEVWRPIPGWPHEASTHGQVRRVPWIDGSGRLHLGGVLAQCPDKRPGKGYLYATLRDGKRRRKAAVAVLVLEAHSGRLPGDGYQACHGNGIRTDNRWCNLRWDTVPANRADRERHRREREVTDAVTRLAGNGAERYVSQVRRGAASHSEPVTAGVTSDGPHGTGRCSIPSTLSFVLPSVQSLRSLRSRRKAH